MKYKALRNKEYLHYVDGPGNGLSYYAHTLNPDLTCRDVVEAQRAAKIANIAYKAGYAKAQYDVRAALGLDE